MIQSSEQPILEKVWVNHGGRESIFCIGGRRAWECWCYAGMKRLSVTVEERKFQFTASENAEFMQNWRTNISSAEPFSIAKIQKNRLLYVTVEGVQSIVISCKELYPDCNLLRLGGWEDPMNCFWCADTIPFHTITSSEVKGCRNHLKHECPPDMRWVGVTACLISASNFLFIFFRFTSTITTLASQLLEKT